MDTGKWLENEETGTSMKIEEINIKNFRHIEDLTLKIGDMLALIGPNNVGKSSILKAIQSFCEPKNRIPTTDFNAANGYPDIEIAVIFSNLTKEDKERYASRILNGEKLIVKKKWVNGTRKPDFFSKELRPIDTNLADMKSNWKDLRDDDIWKIRAETEAKAFRLRDEVIEFVTLYLHNNQDDFEWEETWVPNPSGLQEILTHHMPEVIFVEGVVDAPEQATTKQGALFTQILSLLVEEALEHDENAKEAHEQVQKLVSRISQKPLGDVQRIQSINELEDDLAKYMPAGMKAKFIIDATEIPFSRLIQQAAKLKVDDGIPTPLENKGHGMQRATVFSLFRTYSALRRRRKLEDSDEEQDKNLKRPHLFLVEEPELYLHPQAQHQMADSFQDLVDDDNQIIFSTHSPILIDLSQAERVCILNKNEDGNLSKKQLNRELFEADERSRFKLLEYMNPHRSELFFAKRTVFVEGESDRIVLEMMGKHLDVHNSEISIVETGGKDNLSFYIQLAEAFELDYVVMHDEDAKDEDIGEAPVIETGECEECFKRKRGKFKKLKGHPKKNNDIQELITKGQLITWYKTLNDKFSIPKGKSKGASAQQWCEKVQNGTIDIPLELKEAVQKIYSLEAL